MFFLRVTPEKQTRKFKLTFSQDLRVSSKTIKAFAIEASLMYKFAAEFAATLQVLIDEFHVDNEIFIETTDILITVLPIEKDQKLDAKTFKEKWLPFVERTLFELTSDPKYNILDSEFEVKLSERDIDESKVKQTLIQFKEFREMYGGDESSSSDDTE